MTSPPRNLGNPEKRPPASSVRPELIEGREGRVLRQAQGEPGPGGPTIAVVDYGAGNLLSVTKALAAVGVTSYLASDPVGVLSADAVILPGVGAAGDAMRELDRRDLIEPVREVVKLGRAFLGVCLGLQVLYESSDEDGGVTCLGILEGGCRKLPDGLKVPHMGWNTVSLQSDHPFVNGIADDSYFYFVHSYYVEPADPSTALGVTEYGARFASIVASDNVLGVQFHPEKSADNGLRLYQNFAHFAQERPDASGPPQLQLAADV